MSILDNGYITKFIFWGSGRQGPFWRVLKEAFLCLFQAALGGGYMLSTFNLSLPGEWN